MLLAFLSFFLPSSPSPRIVLLQHVIIEHHAETKQTNKKKTPHTYNRTPPLPRRPNPRHHNLRQHILHRPKPQRPPTHAHRIHNLPTRAPRRRRPGPEAVHLGPVRRHPQRQVPALPEPARHPADRRAALHADGQEGEGVRFQQGRRYGVRGCARAVRYVDCAEGVG